jgi:hypothetical protein
MEILERFYERVSKSNNLEGLDIPPSCVFYIRRAIEEKTGILYDLEHVEVSLFLEGGVDPDKHFPTALPKWYVDKYLNGVAPDMDKLRIKLREKYLKNRPYEVLALRLRSLCYPADSEEALQK